MDQFLSWIEPGNIFSGPCQFSRWIICPLFCHKLISNNFLLVTCNLRHISKLIQRLSSLVQDLIHEIEAKVIYLIILWILDIISGLKTIFEIITDHILEEIPEDSGFRWKTEGQYGCEQSPKLRS